MPHRTNHRREVLEWLGERSHTYDELLARYRQALPASDVDTHEALAVVIGSLVGEGLLEREVVPDGTPEAGAVRRLWLSEKGKSLVASNAAAR